MIDLTDQGLANDPASSGDCDHLHGQVKFIEKEVEVEVCERNDAYEQTHQACQDAEEMEICLKEEEAAQNKLRKEATWVMLEAKRQCESSLSVIQALHGCLEHLEFDAYRFEVIENYYKDILRKVEMALARKAKFDYLKMQLLVELKSHLEQFHYPSWVTDCLDALREIERRGGGLVLECENGDEDGEDQEIGEGLSRDS